MYRTSEMILSARLSAVDGVHRVSDRLFESAGRLFGLYADAGWAVLAAAARPGWDGLPRYGAEWLAGHFSVARDARDVFIEAALTQGRAHGELARRALDLGANFAPPEVERALRMAGSTLAASLESADRLARTTAQAASAIEAAVERAVAGEPVDRRLRPRS